MQIVCVLVQRLISQKHGRISYMIVIVCYFYNTATLVENQLFRMILQLAAWGINFGFQVRLVSEVQLLQQMLLTLVIASMPSASNTIQVSNQQFNINFKYLIVNLVFSHLGFWSGIFFLIVPFPLHCQLVPFHMALSQCSVKSV